MKKFTISKVISLFSMVFAVTVSAQKLEDSKLGFGKAYIKDELKDPNGIIRCASTGYEKYLQATDPNRMTDAQFEAWINPLIEKAKLNKSQNGGVVTIPVVVHVIHSGEAYGTGANITDEQVQSQITVMNQDFRRMAGTPGYNTTLVGADTMIQFALAKVDANGNPTNGIDRVNLCYPDWSTGNINGYVKPLTIWNPTEYMNMWSVNFSDNTLLGYAQFPSNSTIPMPAGGAANTDGVVANYTTFGSTDYGSFPMNAPYDKGRTMTHEVGHFLGLRHIWGDATCGNDYCADTPTAHTANYTCNTNIAGCTAGEIEMVRNYMDYTNDTCMNIFTQNQKDRITTVMNNSPRRVELKTSIKDVAIPLFPNDAEIKFENACSLDNLCTGYTLRIVLTNRGTAALTAAVIPYTVNGTAYSYNWSGNLAQDKYEIVSLPIPTTATNGPLTVNLTSVNGVADQRVSNNTLTGTFNNPAIATNTATNFVFNLQLDYWGSEVNWNLKNSAGTIVYSSGNGYQDVPNPTTSTPLPALITQNWTLNTNDCYTFTINDVYGDGIYDNGGFYNIKTTAGADVIVGSSYSKKQTRALRLGALGTSEMIKETFAIYPNPTTDVLNITKVSNKAKFEIHNAVGQIVKAGEIKNNQVRVSELVRGTYIITVSDKGVSETLKFIKK
ncbi:M43 family zinc metalloprotease [Chryseobacterium scophthalmum]|uniref:Por secretion system C-terminal sorting domain-containing protein n=1 Tax=Chryseobacterium scophthalmum TaxID=59733 RepID=A0A1N6IX84_9FLAO|nr:M43 family zinc metalloprotease [Chryseobacterium scophthalmum]SIO36632.1 Por secretion system C-terminal sorting domain-containing protein [Chryseobacterium scophthalmum]